MMETITLSVFETVIAIIVISISTTGLLLILEIQRSRIKSLSNRTEELISIAEQFKNLLNESISLNKDMMKAINKWESEI